MGRNIPHTGSSNVNYTGTGRNVYAHAYVNTSYNYLCSSPHAPVLYLPAGKPFFVGMTSDRNLQHPANTPGDRFFRDRVSISILPSSLLSFALPRQQSGIVIPRIALSSGITNNFRFPSICLPAKDSISYPISIISP